MREDIAMGRKVRIRWKAESKKETMTFMTTGKEWTTKVIQTSLGRDVIEFVQRNIRGMHISHLQYSVGRLRLSGESRMVSYSGWGLTV